MIDLRSFRGSASVARRADLRNGVCLHVLRDRAFDRGLITFDDDLTLIVFPHLRPAALVDALLAPDGVEGARLRPPKRFAPDSAALAQHMEHVFRS